jgi:hypothetical protein
MQLILLKFSGLFTFPCSLLLKRREQLFGGLYSDWLLFIKFHYNAFDWIILLAYNKPRSIVSFNKQQKHQNISSEPHWEKEIFYEIISIYIWLKLSILNKSLLLCRLCEIDWARLLKAQQSWTEFMLYVVLTMPTLNKAYLFIYLIY